MLGLGFRARLISSCTVEYRNAFYSAHSLVSSRKSQFNHKKPPKMLCGVMFQFRSNHGAECDVTRCCNCWAYSILLSETPDLGAESKGGFSNPITRRVKLSSCHLPDRNYRVISFKWSDVEVVGYSVARKWNEDGMKSEPYIQEYIRHPYL